MAKKNVINIPLRKVHALEIIRGEKKREYRAFNDHWASRLCLFEDQEDRFLATGIKFFDEVHFYPYNNKWHLDVAVKDIEWRTVDDDFIKEFGEEVEAEEGTQVFIIHLGEVLDTNLTA